VKFLDEIISGLYRRWLYENTEGEIHVALDWAPYPNGIFRFATNDIPERVSRTDRGKFISGEFPRKGSYIFLRTINEKNGLLYTGAWNEPIELAKHLHLFEEKNKIYVGEAEIYY
jgi:hypothetical protein